VLTAFEITAVVRGLSPGPIQTDGAGSNDILVSSTVTFFQS